MDIKELGVATFGAPFQRVQPPRVIASAYGHVVGDYIHQQAHIVFAQCGDQPLKRFLAPLTVLAFVVTACRALQQGLKPGQSRYQLFLVGLMLVFMLAQSFFNRYLIGVGNPYSLWILVLILQVNLRPMAAVSTHRARHVSRSAYPSHRLDRIPT